MSEGVGGVGEGKKRGQEGEAHELKEGTHDEEEETERALKHALKKWTLAAISRVCVFQGSRKEGGGWVEGRKGERVRGWGMVIL